MWDKYVRVRTLLFPSVALLLALQSPLLLPLGYLSSRSDTFFSFSAGGKIGLFSSLFSREARLSALP